LTKSRLRTRCLTFEVEHAMSARRQCEFESTGPVDKLLAQYDLAADRWKVPLAGDFWSAIKAAHEEGLTGKGRKVAILDSPCDYEIPRLKKQTGGGPKKRGPFREPTGHGTLVALLVGAVAPDCTIELYEITRNGRPDVDAVIAALDEISSSASDVVCLSLGIPTEFDTQSFLINAAGQNDLIRWIESGKRSELIAREDMKCPLCESAERTAASGKIVVAAVGNDSGDIFCPARNKEVVAVGFRLEQRSVKKTDDEGAWEAAYWAPPSYDQSILSDITIAQIPEALGSSFACPLFAGAAALGIKKERVKSLLKSLRFNGEADGLLPMLGMMNSREFVSLTGMLYKRALEIHPHRKLDIKDPTDRLECRIFSIPLFVNYGLFSMSIDDCQRAEVLLNTARGIAPWDANAAANLGRLYQIKAERSLSSYSTEHMEFIREAEKLYLEALKLRPEMKVYENQLAQIRLLIREWS